MKLRINKLFLEITGIILIAVTVGIAWNYRLLIDAGTGKLIQPIPPESSRGSVQGMLPAPLAQVRELFEHKDTVFVDARENTQFLDGHIKGAVSLPLGEFKARLETFRANIKPDAVLVVYCSGYGCHDSTSLGNLLVANGYHTVFTYEGGYPEWKDAGLPVAGGNP